MGCVLTPIFLSFFCLSETAKNVSNAVNDSTLLVEATVKSYTQNATKTENIISHVSKIDKLSEVTNRSIGVIKKEVNN